MKTGKRNSTGANGGNGEENLCSLRFLLFKSGCGGVVELDFDKSISDGVNIYAKRDGDADFVFLACRAVLRRRRARDTASTYIDNRLPALHSLGDGRANTKPSMPKATPRLACSATRSC